MSMLCMVGEVFCGTSITDVDIITSENIEVASTNITWYSVSRKTCSPQFLKMSANLPQPKLSENTANTKPFNS